MYRPMISATFSSKRGSSEAMYPAFSPAVSIWMVRRWWPALAEGGKWLSASLSPPNLSISVNPVGLAPGDYTGAVTFVSTTAYSPPIPVGLTVYKAPAPSLSVNPTSLVFDSSCSYCDQTLTLTTGDIALDFSVSVSTVDGYDWLDAYLPQSAQTTAGVTPAQPLL